MFLIRAVIQNNLPLINAIRFEQDSTHMISFKIIKCFNNVLTNWITINILNETNLVMCPGQSLQDLWEFFCDYYNPQYLYMTQKTEHIYLYAFYTVYSYYIHILNVPQFPNKRTHTDISCHYSHAIIFPFTIVFFLMWLNFSCFCGDCWKVELSDICLLLQKL